MNPRRNYARNNDQQYDTKAELGLPPELFPGPFSYEQITLLHQRAYRAEMDLSPLSKDERQTEKQKDRSVPFPFSDVTTVREGPSLSTEQRRLLSALNSTAPGEVPEEKKKRKTRNSMRTLPAEGAAPLSSSPASLSVSAPPDRTGGEREDEREVPLEREEEREERDEEREEREEEEDDEEEEGADWDEEEEDSTVGVLDHILYLQMQQQQYMQQHYMQLQQQYYMQQQQQQQYYMH
uniref:Uncharacterized protein n=1 Tax=Chromera velia CCMP2878 TaxID=1169474 RepID=A0A0G4HX02_9ALVE|eukprot:Cvel_9150.t1-p1 / transcript=Cvel_9150.t1 / gene=Cvel_9150 / organism=Chromera_velia_CCMP2878 / gene_product=hypothetical protein / transcript_product=hypothetical protein / location=Cvel_scaffold521:2485-3574(-) / protein_length=236 / sequence_SO=supercontig / SO=protein_coding / is_pseudo=false